MLACHVSSYRIQDLFPIPDGLVAVFRTGQGQIEIARRPPQILVNLYKDRCAEFHGFECCAVIWVNCNATFKEINENWSVLRKYI